MAGRTMPSGSGTALPPISSDRHVQRHRAGTDDVEHAAHLVLERQRDRLGEVVLVDELHHRVEAEHGRHAERRR